jgi:hypothetical protein
MSGIITVDPFLPLAAPVEEEEEEDALAASSKSAELIKVLDLKSDPKAAARVESLLLLLL